MDNQVSFRVVLAFACGGVAMVLVSRRIIFLWLYLRGIEQAHTEGTNARYCLSYATIESVYKVYREEDIMTRKDKENFEDADLYIFYPLDFTTKIGEPKRKKVDKKIWLVYYFLTGL